MAMAPHPTIVSRSTSPAGGGRVTEHIKRELRRRSAIEPVIGHAESEHRMGRNDLAGLASDAINAVLAAAGYNFRRLPACAIDLSDARILLQPAGSKQRLHHRASL
jgi:Transposase DDE domain